MEENVLKQKQKRTYIIMSLIIILALILGISYAYFLAQDQSAEQAITSGNINIAFDDNSNGEIAVNNLYPILESEIEEKAYVNKFSITNTGNLYEYVNIYLSDITIDDGLKNTDFRWALYKTDQSSETKVKITEGNFRYSENEVLLLPNAVLGTTDTEKTQYYSLYIYVNENNYNQNYLLNQSLNMVIRAVASDKKQEENSLVQRNFHDLNDPDAAPGYYLNPNYGSLAANASYYSTGYIEVKPGDIVKTSYLSFGTNKTMSMLTIAAYDENKNFLKSSTQSRVTEYIVQDDGTKYVRISHEKFANNYTYIVSLDNTNLISSKNNDLSFHLVDGVAYLPEEIDVAVGRTINLYNNQVVKSDKNYTFVWESKVGTSDELKYTVTGTTDNIGKHELVLKIYDEFNTIYWMGETTINIVDDTLDNSYSILPIGDSLTNQKSWLATVKSLSNNMINFVGTRSYTNGIMHEGRSGWSAGSYLFYESSGDDSNAFYNTETSRFDWNYYKTSTGINPDAVMIFLGTNGGGLGFEDDSFKMKQMVDYIRQDDNNIPIYIVNTLYGGEDNLDKYQYIYRQVYLTHSLLKNYNNLYFIPIALTHDSANNFNTSDLVHPTEAGYNQFADTIFSTFAAKMK